MKFVKFFSLILVLAFSVSTMALAEVSPTEITGATTVSDAEAKTLFDDGAAFIDVRKDSDWEAGRVPDAIHIELKKVFSAETLGAEVAKGEKLVIYCNGESCMRSSKASAMAVGWGYTSIYYYRNGFPGWKAAGYPVE